MAVLSEYKAGKHHVLVATDVAARGLDIKCVIETFHQCFCSAFLRLFAQSNSLETSQQPLPQADELQWLIFCCRLGNTGPSRA